MKLSTILSTLAELDVRPSKNLGQNFLHDQNLAEWIVAQLQLTPEDFLVEVGPGLGALTEFALPRCRAAVLIEKDRRLAASLQARFAGTNASIVQADALDFDPRTLFPEQPVKVLGNLPYNVTSPLLFQFTADPSPCARIVVTVQREFAERLAAQPSTKDYGALTLILGRRWRVEYLRTLPASVFIPNPNVESAVIGLTPRPPDELPACDGERFHSLVKAGFSQRRKQLRKMLAPFHLNWPELAAQLGVTETARAEELSLPQWIDLTNRSQPGEHAEAQDVHGEIFDVVDLDDRVTGSASRHEVHTSRLLHRAVHIFVFNRAGELFLQKRSHRKDVHPLCWDSSAAGHVNGGGDYAATAARELEEELGISAPLELIGTITACKETGFEFVHLFQTKNEGPFQLAPAEIETGGFFPVSLIREWIARRPEDFATGFLKCFAKYELEKNA